MAEMFDDPAAPAIDPWAMTATGDGAFTASPPQVLSNAPRAMPADQGGPNGGYLAGLMLQAAAAALPDAPPPRSLSVQFLAAPAFAPLTLRPQVLRPGRSTAFVSVTADQGGRLQLAGQALFGLAGDEAWPSAMPDVPAPDETRDVPLPAMGKPHFTTVNDYAFVDGAAFTGGAPLLRCWMRIKDRPLDAAGAAFLLDAIYPSFLVAARKPVNNASVDIRYDFFDAIKDQKPGDWALVVFRTHSFDGAWASEDGELWSQDGRLLALSRQTRKVVRPKPR